MLGWQFVGWWVAALVCQCRGVDTKTKCKNGFGMSAGYHPARWLGIPPPKALHSPESPRPENVRVGGARSGPDIPRTFPGHSPDILRTFPGPSPDLCRTFVGPSPDIGGGVSEGCPKNVRQMSDKGPGKVRRMSGECPGRTLRRRPGHFPDAGFRVSARPWGEVYPATGPGGNQRTTCSPWRRQLPPSQLVARRAPEPTACAQRPYLAAPNARLGK